MLVVIEPPRFDECDETQYSPPPHDRLAVSVLSEVESDLRGRAELVVNAESAPAGEAAAAAPRAIWPWLIAAALALLVLEWLVYCRLSRV